MDAAELRKARDEVLAVHVGAENRNDVDAVIATFKHPRYELVPVREIFDGEAEVRRYYREKEARGRRRHEVVKAYHADEAVIVEIRTSPSSRVRPPGWTCRASRSSSSTARISCASACTTTLAHRRAGRRLTSVRRHR